ncbi:aquaporin [Streptomyces sp. NPDC004980]
MDEHAHRGDEAPGRIVYLLAGVLVAVVIAALMYSRPGRASGGHMHTGVTLFVWLAGGLPGAAVLPYAAAQLTGSLAGTGPARLVWGPAVEEIGFSAVHPAAGWGDGLLFAVEAASIAPIFVAVACVAAHPALAKYVPVVIAVGVGLVVALLGLYSGASINPARQFGPALLAGAARPSVGPPHRPARRSGPGRPGPAAHGRQA